MWGSSGLCIAVAWGAPEQGPPARGALPGAETRAAGCQRGRQGPGETPGH